MSNLENLKNEIILKVAEYTKIKSESESFLPGKTAIPASGKFIDCDEYINMVEAVLDGWLTTGRFNDEFQSKLSNFLGIKFLLTTNSGSSANLLALTALTSELLGERAIMPGDEVITVAAGFPTTINPIIQNNAIPVFMDVDIKTHNIDVSLLNNALTHRTKAVMLAHSLGNPFNLKVILEFCKKNNLWLIEDNCDALGSKYNNQLTGTFGDIGTLSFYPAHHITMGEGGAVFTNNHLLKKILESFRDWGRDCYCQPGKDNTCGKRFQWQLGELPYGYDHKYTYSHMGFNLKITDMQAACGLAQLQKLDYFIQKRKDNFNFLKKRLQSCEELLQLPEPTENSEPSWFGFPITVKNNSPIQRKELVEYLNQFKIGTRYLFAGNVVKQPYMKHKNYRIVGELKNTDNIMMNTFWIGVFPSLNEDMLDYVASKIEEIIGVRF